MHTLLVAILVLLLALTAVPLREPWRMIGALGTLVLIVLYAVGIVPPIHG